MAASRDFAVLVVLGLAAFQLHAESWHYQSWNNGSKGDIGHITLLENGSTATLQFFSGTQMSRCYRTALKAAVERTADTITITTEPIMGGCDTVRFLIKADGSGGVREVKQGDAWVRDVQERDLRLKQ